MKPKPCAIIARVGEICALVPLLAALSSTSGVRADEEVGIATYVRSDSDDTVVVAPRLRLRVPVEETTHLSLVYAVDVWTSASIDIVTSASPIPVTEQRDEINLSVDHEFPDVTVTAAYRYSTEPDYESHGGSGGFGYDFADNNATVALGVSGSSDTVGRAGDPKFARDVSTLGTRLSFTQVIDTDSVVQFVYELSSAKGYLASAYRFVPIGGTRGCTGAEPVAIGEAAAPLCVPEVNPGDRLRHALSAYGRHSMSDNWSIGLGYRFYTDDWGIQSHTVRAELGLMLGEETALAGRYRFYTQGSADHYQQHYDLVLPYLTNDKELSSLSSHRLGLELEHDFAFADNHVLSVVVSASPIFYSYSNFTPLDSITAFEANAALRFLL